MDKNNISESVNNNDAISIEELQSFIYTVRGQQVMLDSELAKFYNVETRVLNQAVKRNKERFPDRFMYQLTHEELESLRSQIVTLKGGRGQHSKYMPYVFTEQGVAQLSSVLKSNKAIEVSIMIMDAFVAMRRFLSANAGMFQRIENLEQHQRLTDQKVENVLQRMEELAPTVTPEQIFATGCIWDAWSYVSQLIKSAKQRIVLVDNFVDDRVLTLLSKRKNGVCAIVHSRYNEHFLLDLRKHNEQYEQVEFVQIPHKSHDRFLIIDDEVYLMGASVKDMGTSLCAITKMSVSPEKILMLIK
ncbi:MAG: ORF6N domain-containing protein [Paludibacteraceae bacterium]|nr:ORF6N domain-containing protein [Paludibacteraceae bacterium]